jgi:transposase/transposase-like protein
MKDKKMITMVDKNEILIRFFRKGESKSEIARRLKITRTTVRKIVSEYERMKNSPNFESILEEGLSSKPRYKSENRPKLKLIEEVQFEIDSCLEENNLRRQQGMHKQVMKKVDIHAFLESKGFDISYSTVCAYIRKEESRTKEAFIKQIYPPGSSCEFDWGEVKLFIGGQKRTFNMAVFTCCYSNYRYAKLFHRQDNLAFNQSHIDFFEHLGGVVEEMIYDNMRVAVKRFVGRTEKEPTQGLLELSNYYHYAFRFCNARRGNEKGHVERSVEHVRRKAFSATVEFVTLEQANGHLLKRCGHINQQPQRLAGNKSATEMIEQEQKHLYRVQSPYKCFVNEQVKIDKYATFIYAGNRYSVPDSLVGKMLDLKVFAEHLVVYHNNKQIHCHVRSYGAHTWTLELSHSLHTLLRKPGAIKNSMALQQADEYLTGLYTNLFKGEEKQFIELLHYCDKYKLSTIRLKKAVDKVTSITKHDVSKDKIIAILELGDNNEHLQQGNESDPISSHSSAILEELSQIAKQN